MDTNQTSSRQNAGSTAWQIIGRLVVSAIVLGITAFFTPGFSINNIWSLAIAAIVLTVMDYLIVKFTGLHASPFGKGFVRFRTCCYYTIFNTIFCRRIFYFLDGCKNRCINLRSNWLLHSWRTGCVVWQIIEFWRCWTTEENPRCITYTPAVFLPCPPSQNINSLPNLK